MKEMLCSCLYVLVLLLPLTCLNAHAATINWVQWKAANGGNDHWYAAIHKPNGIYWQDANLEALRSNPTSHLATINSSDENAFVFSLIDEPIFWFGDVETGGNSFGPWIGGVQLIGAEEPAGGWRWVTSEAWDYTNWYAGEPNNFNGEENSVHFQSGRGIADTWNDFPNIFDSQLPGGGVVPGMLGYVMETTVIPLPGALPLLCTGVMALAAIGGVRRKISA